MRPTTSSARSSGGVTATRLGTGAYRVDFNQDVSNCVYLANVGDTGALAGAFGAARPRRDSTDPERIFIETVGDIDGPGDDPHIVQLDLPFHVGAFC